MSELKYPCPSCKDKSLAPIEEKEIAFLGCEDCFGLFVNVDDLGDYCVAATNQKSAKSAYEQLLEKAAEKPPRAGIRGCPVCGNKLNRFGFGESPFVILDRCHEHGVWLDKKELKKVIRSCRAHSAVIGLIPRFSDGGDDDD